MIGGFKSCFLSKNNLGCQAAAKAKRQAKAKAKASAKSKAKAKAKPKAKAAALPTLSKKRRLKLKTVSELVKRMKRQDGSHDNQGEAEELAAPDLDTTVVSSEVSAGASMALVAEEERPDSQGPAEVEVQVTPPPSPPNRPSSSASVANDSKPKSSSSSSSSSSSTDAAPAASSHVQGEEDVFEEEPAPKRTKFQPSGCVKMHLGVLITQVLS